MTSNATGPAQDVPQNTRRHLLKDAVRKAGRRMDWLATATGFSVTYVSKVANGHLNPSPQFRRLAAEALELPESDLFEDVPA